MTTSPEAINHAAPTRFGAFTRAAAAPSPSLVFGGAIALSAFLLFTAEPMVARLAQPVFGGAPAVWATVLVFFQVMLLAGYAYAHLVATRLAPGRGAILHIAVAFSALGLTLAAPRVVSGLVDAAIPTVLNVLLVLTAIAGPATFVMTATTPLVSSWYARERIARDAGGERSDPYWLYALSNFGSLVSLLAYLFLIQPFVGLSAQREAWMIGFGLLVALLAVAAARSRGSVGSALMPSVRARSQPIATSRRLRWILLAAIPSGLLSAVTNLVTTDLLSAPLLWVVPLILYLATFVVAFSERGRRAMPAIIAVTPAALTLLWVPLGYTGGWPIVPLLLIEYAGLAIVALALHGRLAADRPAAEQLTGFYLTMSLGGAIGGAFVGVLAPVAFRGIWEYPILIAIAAVALAMTRPHDDSRRRPLAAMFGGWTRRVIPFLVVAVLVLATMQLGGAVALGAAVRWLLVGGLVLLVGGQPRVFAISTVVVLALITIVLPPPAIFRDRSFFGVTQVIRSDDGQLTMLLHGTTPHGFQRSDPAHREDPGSYYARSGPIGDLFGVLADRAPMEIRVTGLGAGGLASYARSDDELVFYEIDPLIEQVARDPDLFTFLRDARGTVDVRVGDGRLLVAAEADASTDLLMLDAFTSDALPVHLITAEALRDVHRILRPGGLIAIHVSNRYYDLEPPVAAAMEAAGFNVVRRVYAPTAAEAEAGATVSHWLVGGRPGESDADLAALQGRGWSAPRVGEPLTDDFADLLRYLRLR
jgi:SAM-dependent methyltransferase